MLEVQTYLDEIRDLPSAPLLEFLVQQVRALDPEVRAEVGAFGLRLKLGEGLLCELSVFGELFIARVGPQQAVEYRVRGREVALAALDHVLRDYVELRAAARRPPPDGTRGTDPHLTAPGLPSPP